MRLPLIFNGFLFIWAGQLYKFFSLHIRTFYIKLKTKPRHVSDMTK